MSSKLRFFRLNSLSFTYRGVEYKKGDVIQTEADLATAWENLFTEVPEPPPPSAATTPPVAGGVPGQANPQAGKEANPDNQALFTVRHRGAGFYDVLRVSDGSRMNADKLPRQAAIELVEQLTASARRV